MNHLSIDIGGTKIRVITYTNNLEPIKEKVYKTKVFFDMKNFKKIEIFLEYIQKYFGEEFNKIGISFNCPIKKNKIFYSSLLGGKVDIDLKKTCEKYFSFESFSSDNDVYCMAKAEMCLGKAQAYSDILYVNIGTGIRVVGTSSGKIIRGQNNLAGEISQDKYWVNEIKKFIATDFLPSGKGFLTLSKELFGKTITAEVAFKDNNVKLISLFSKYLAKTISRSCYFYNPEAIFFGGSLTLSKKLWLNKFKSSYVKICHPLFITNNIFISELKHPASLGALLD